MKVIILESRKNNGEHEERQYLDGMTKREFMQKALIGWPLNGRFEIEIAIQNASKIYDAIETSLGENNED